MATVQGIFERRSLFKMILLSHLYFIFVYYLGKLFPYGNKERRLAIYKKAYKEFENNRSSGFCDATELLTLWRLPELYKYRPVYRMFGSDPYWFSTAPYGIEHRKWILLQIIAKMNKK